MPTANTQQALRASWSTRIPPPATGNQTVAFGRRSQSVRNISYPRDEHDGALGTGELSDVQPMDAAASTNLDPSISARVEEQYVSNSLFTGGFNSVTRAQLMNKVIDSESIHPQMAGAKGSSCAVPGCGAKVMSDERGNDILPCDCDYKICRDCFVEGLQANGLCPGCKEPYRAKDLDEVVANAKPHPSLQSPSARMSKMERRLSLMKSRSYGRSLTGNPAGDLDHSRWLFETKGTYGYGNAIWPREKDGDGDGGQPVEVVNKPWRPLTRRLKIPAAVLSPYSPSRELQFVTLHPAIKPANSTL